MCGRTRLPTAEVVAAVNRAVRNRVAFGPAAALHAVAAAVESASRVEVPVGPVSTESVLAAMAELR